MRYIGGSKHWLGGRARHYWGTEKMRVTSTAPGKEDARVVLKKRKAVPKGCSVPKQICISCQQAVVKKLSKHYDKKLCSSCAETGASNE